MSFVADALHEKKAMGSELTDGLGPELPRTVIEPRPGWQLLDLAALWRYRELLYFLTWRDIKVRYKQTVLGAAWAILQPFATMIVFTVFLGPRMGAKTSDVPYSLFVFAGLLGWLFISNGVTSAGQSIVGSYNLVTKVYFPRLLIPASAVGVGLLDFLLGFGMLLLLMVVNALWPDWSTLLQSAVQQPVEELQVNPVYPGWSILLLPVIILFLVALTLGMGILLSALTVAYRDFRYVVPFGTQLWMFATPSIYLQADSLGPRGQLIVPLNPAHGLILNFRQVVLGEAPDWYALAVSGGVSLLLLVIGCLYFRRVERTFADII